MPRARYKQLVDQLAADIRRGALAPGTRLPTHRELAAQHGIALVTASRVYTELHAMGLVSGETGRGTFVRETSLAPGHGIDQPATEGGMLDLNFNYPTLPGQADLLRQALRQLALSGDLEALLRYQPHAGRPHERALLARHLTDQGLPVTAQQVLIVNGAQHGLALTLQTLLKPGDVVAVDALTYPGFKAAAAARGVELLALPCEASGPDFDALAALCRTRRVRAIYSMPTLHNPLGWVLDQLQRERLIDIARQHDLLIIEDAAYAFLASSAPAPLAALAPERTVHVSGFSKNIATGLRVGYLTAPAAWVAALERSIRASTWNTPGIMTALVCAWIEDGTLARLQAQKREDARCRQALARRVLAGLQLIGHKAGYFLWLPLPAEVRADQVVARLLHEQVAVSTAEPFSTSEQVPHALRLALGSVTLAQLEDALDKVRHAIAHFAY
ncbi:PLP-dependent aminotransferase family protein [Pseudomonas sp. LMG 31766]|uniref:PLP-dependent aminotransferase family protein n=1 Tax=Pseudomonas chaetocerotis TaxID=2758695 RepID=A0A931CVP4_9PSED|nr:PLP-dependent aminotransferase family protein [Pseudomonas chaetocerotis]MBZ9666085.1 PLP-dependent aminotransferase family protein [Pseudomonas chaetocerotis]